MSVDKEREKRWEDGGGEEFFTSLLASGPIPLTRLVPSVTVTTSLAPGKLVRNDEDVRRATGSVSLLKSQPVCGEPYDFWCPG